MRTYKLDITKECCDWLEPIVRDLPDSSYERSAVDAVLNHVMSLEKKLEKALLQIEELKKTT